MSDATCATPDLTTLAGLDELGLGVIGHVPGPGRAALAFRVVKPDRWCRRCGEQRAVRDTVSRWTLGTGGPPRRGRATPIVDGVTRGMGSSPSTTTPLPGFGGRAAAAMAMSPRTPSRRGCPREFRRHEGPFRVAGCGPSRLDGTPCRHSGSCIGNATGGARNAMYCRL